MKIALYSRPENPSLPQLLARLEGRGVQYALNPTQVTGVDFICSFGGDGTFLSTVRSVGTAHGVPFLGINSGRLGFMAAMALDDLADTLDKLEDGNYTVEQRTLLEVAGQVAGTAVNEFTIQKSGTGMISVEIELDGEPLATYWADGVIVSTSMGSTAYSLSVGGAILAPGSHCFILSPIAPHNLNIRPLVVSDRSRLAFRIATRGDETATATLDNAEHAVASGSAFEVGRSAQVLRVVRPAGGSFYQALRKKLYWGVDLRNRD